MSRLQERQGPRLKFMATVLAGQSPSNDDVEEVGALPFIQGCAEFGRFHPAPMKFCDVAPKVAQPGDVLLSVRAPVGELNIAIAQLGIGRGVAAVRPAGYVHPRFLYWFLASSQVALRAQATGSTFEAVSSSDIGNLRFPNATISRQAEIANFLDEQTVRIDALIAEKERLQAALTEWRAAELTRMCFGGGRACISTGNQWISELPQGWKLARLKHLITRIEQGWSPECEAREADDGEWGVLKAGASNGGLFRDREHKALPPRLEPIPELEVRPGDVIVSRASGSADLVGSFAYVYSTRPRLMLSDKNFRLKFSPRPPVQPELVAWICNTPPLREQVRQYVSGAEGLAKNIGIGSLRELWVPVAPSDEQARIVSELGTTNQRLSALDEHLTEHIDRLREYRSSLISATVTGQLDIDAYRAHAPQALEAA